MSPAGESAGRWRVTRLHGGASELHHRAWPAPVVPTVWVLTVDRPALVLGSTQTEPPPDHHHGVDVVRRRSGGGAVLVEPGGVLWVDVLVPAGDPLWHPDVGRASYWLGDLWARALAAEGVEATGVHRGATDRSALARAVCFAGLGPGEVTVGGRKAVGISQRRTRAGALFQCAALLRWDPERMGAVTHVPARDLGDVAAAVPVGQESLERRLLRELSRV